MSHSKPQSPSTCSTPRTHRHLPHSCWTEPNSELTGLHRHRYLSHTSGLTGDQALQTSTGTGAMEVLHSASPSSSSSSLSLLLLLLTVDWTGLGAAPFSLNDTSPGEPFPWDQPRLPANIRPDHYFIHIHPDLISQNFEGEVRITLTASSDAHFIVLNSRGLAIKSASIHQPTGQEPTPTPPPTGSQGQPTSPAGVRDQVPGEQLLPPLHAVNEEQEAEGRVEPGQAPLHADCPDHPPPPPNAPRQAQLPLRAVKQIPLRMGSHNQASDAAVSQEESPAHAAVTQEKPPPHAVIQKQLTLRVVNQVHNFKPAVNADHSYEPPVSADPRPQALPPRGWTSVRVLESPSREQLALIPEMPLRAGLSYQISLTYSGSISSSFSGLYASSYRTPQGTSRTIVATHFEPSSARKVFPCFDEPGMKAIFSVVIVRDSEHISLSNMPKGSTVPNEDGLLEDHFLPTVKMSPYLLAFVVCDFSSTSAQTKRGVTVSVFAPSHQVNQTDHALQTAVKLLDFYEDYLQIPYPLPKIDLVAVPDFEAGAMENWGLVTFRESSLLSEVETGDPWSRVYISLVIAHELAHQWFGNLVTMEWWDGLWLNEGFASYLEHTAVDLTEPSWGVGDQLLLASAFRALERDAFLTSHPVSQPVSNTTQIAQMFDVISYAKGSSLLRMLHIYLTDQVFTDGIRLYLRQHSYGVTHQADLWGALSEVSRGRGRDDDVEALMEPWVGQQGYPVVSVTRKGNRALLRQDQFTSRPQNDSDSLWPIPFTFYTSTSSSPRTHLMKSREEVIDLPSEVLWIKANVNSSRFYRVCYTGALQGALSAQLRRDLTVFSAADRAGLLDDTFHLASQGALQYSEAFQLSLFLQQEEELPPISIFLHHMTGMMRKFSFSKQPCVIRLLKAHTWSMLGRLMKAQRWEDDGSLSNQSRRAKLLSLATELRHPPAEQHALRLFHFWMAKEGQHPLPRTLRTLVYREGIRRGGGAEWSFLLQRYRESSSAAQRTAMLAALCHTSNRSSATWLLQAALLNTQIKTQDLALIVSQLARRYRTNHLTWAFLQRNWDTLLTKFSLGSPFLSGVVTAITSQFYSQKKYNEGV
ncbi:hypothetical protein AGOR_G00162840 [Albula goreensis]|uniref:Aminopeptidase n=1 Tax=Albula goreensis TaxID=1534307 RepID=A0A8T3D3S0_9TELE|nr:hypothetical protein AGOR_G00162840 [Albula goreensis]